MTGVSLSSLPALLVRFVALRLVPTVFLGWFVPYPAQGQKKVIKGKTQLPSIGKKQNRKGNGELPTE